MYSLNTIATFAFGFIFIAAGLKKVLMPAATGDMIRTTKIYNIAVVDLGITALIKPRVLNAFVIALGLAMASLGLCFIQCDAKRPLVSLVIAGLVFVFVSSIHLNQKNPFKTSGKSLVIAAVNFGIMYGYLALGGHAPLPAALQ